MYNHEAFLVDFPFNKDCFRVERSLLDEKIYIYIKCFAVKIPLAFSSSNNEAYLFAVKIPPSGFVSGT